MGVASPIDACVVVKSFDASNDVPKKGTAMREDRVFAMPEVGDFKFFFDDPDKNYVEFVDGTLNIKLTADVNIKCSNVNINTSGTVTIKAGGTITINGAVVNIN